MLVLDDTTIRASFVNATRKELADLVLPDLAEIAWDRLDYLGWRDARLSKRAYIVVPLPDGPVGIVLKQAEASPRTRAQCSWCQDITLPNDVVLYGGRGTQRQHRRHTHLLELRVLEERAHAAADGLHRLRRGGRARQAHRHPPHPQRRLCDRNRGGTLTGPHRVEPSPGSSRKAPPCSQTS
jgi:hypothetical protein